MKRIFKGLLVMGAAAVVTVGSSLCEVNANPILPANISIDYPNQTLLVKGINGNVKDTKIYVAPATVTKKKVVVNKADKTTKDVTTVKNGAQVEYDPAVAGGEVKVDLSTFAVTKTNYLSVWGNKNTDPVLVELPAIKTRLKAVVNPADLKITIQDITDAKNPVTASETFEYCTLNGTWADYANGTQDLSSYAKFGATLRIRIKASTKAAFQAGDYKEIGTDADGASVKAYTRAGTFSGNELKAKVTKIAAGPKATIDYNARTIKIPATSEYRFTAATATALAAFKAAEPDTLANGKLAAIQTLDADAVITADGDFDLRTAKVEAKKAATNITEYKLAKHADTITGDKTKGAKTVVEATKTATITDISNAVVGTANTAVGVKDPLVKCTMVKLANSKTMAMKVTLQNNTADVYQIVLADIGENGKTAVPAANAKVNATLNANKTATISTTSGKMVFIRKMGNAKTTTWSTPYVFLGQVMNEYTEQ